MAKKKNKQVLRPWCWYCEREFEDEKVLMQHQKAKHFKCNMCPRRLNTAGGLAVHIQQVHKLEPENLPRIENALPGRDGYEVEIFGMEGIPAPDVADYKRRKEIELGLSAGSITQPQAKRPKTENRPMSEEELRAQLEAHKALMGAVDPAPAAASPVSGPEASGAAVMYGAPPQTYAPPAGSPMPGATPPVGMPPIAGAPPFYPGMPPPGFPGAASPPGIPGQAPPFSPFPPGSLPPGAPPANFPFPPPPGFPFPPPGMLPPNANGAPPNPFALPPPPPGVRVGPTIPAGQPPFPPNGAPGGPAPGMPPFPPGAPGMPPFPPNGAPGMPPFPPNGQPGFPPFPLGGNPPPFGMPPQQQNPNATTPPVLPGATPMPPSMSGNTPGPGAPSYSPPQGMGGGTPVPPTPQAAVFASSSGGANGSGGGGGVAGQEPKLVLPNPALAQTNPEMKKKTELMYRDANFSPDEVRAIHPKYYFPKGQATSSAPAATGGDEPRGKKRARAEDFL